MARRRLPAPLLDLGRQTDDLDLDDLADTQVGQERTHDRAARHRAPTARRPRRWASGGPRCRGGSGRSPARRSPRSGRNAAGRARRTSGSTPRPPSRCRRPCSSGSPSYRRSRDPPRAADRGARRCAAPGCCRARADLLPRRCDPRDPPSGLLKRRRFNATILAMSYLVKPKDRAPARRERLTPDPSLPTTCVIGAGLQRDRCRQGPLRGPPPLRLLRARQRHRRHVGLPEPQRPVGVLRDAGDQHLVPADGLLGLPDAGGLPRLRGAPPGRRLLRGVRRPLRLPAHDHLRHARRQGRAHRRRPVAGQPSPDRTARSNASTTT